jgi:hypothetical protein
MSPIGQPCMIKRPRRNYEIVLIGDVSLEGEVGAV